MKATDITYRLVKSLTKNEKRYFRMLSAMTEGNKNYLVLFAEMDKQKMYDEQKLKEKLRHKKFVNNLTYEKNYLQKMILRALRNYYANDDKKLGNTISDLEILSEKRLPELFLPLVSKQKQKALENDTLAEYILLSRYELRFVGNMQMSDWFVDYMENGFSNDMNIIDKYKYSLFIIAKYNELNLLQAKYRFTNKAEFSERLAAVIDDPLFEGLYEKLPVKAKIAYYNFFTHYYALRYEFAKSYEASVKQLEYIHQNHLTIEKIGLFNYPAILVSHIENSQHLEKYKEALSYCEKLNDTIHLPVFDQMKSLRNQFEVVYIDFKMNCLAFNKQYKECIDFYSRKAAGLSELKMIGGANLEIAIHFYLAISYFGLKDYDKSLDELLAVFHHEKNTPFAYQIYPSRVIYIMAHIEMGNFEYVANYLRTFKRYFDKKQTDKKTIDALVKIFKEYLICSMNKRNLVSKLPAWLAVINDIKKDNYEKEFIRNTVIERWLAEKSV